MLLLGHAGLTLGAAALLNGALYQRHVVFAKQSRTESVSAQDCNSDGRTSWLTSLGNKIDVRLLLIGSLLPDIVDKPIGIYLFKDTFGSGRIYCHTLLVTVLIALAGFYLWRNRRKLWLLTIAFGMFCHLVLDGMWLTPKTLLWPFYGFAFERGDTTGWLAEMWHALHSDPGAYVPEAIGAAILMWFAWDLVRNKTMWEFIRHGKVL